VLDTRSPSQRAADMIAAIDHVVTSPSERAAAAIATIDRALRTSVPTTSCWFCGNPLTPNEVGLPCPACGDGNGVATDSPGPHIADKLASWRAEYGWRTQRNMAWHNWYETAAR
jgi:hypothetical protein